MAPVTDGLIFFFVLGIALVAIGGLLAWAGSKAAGGLVLPGVVLIFGTLMIQTLLH